MIPARWPDLDPPLLAILREAMDGATVRNEKPTIAPGESAVVIDIAYQNTRTPLSRYARVRITGHALLTSGESDMPTARTLVLDACAALEAAPTDGAPLISAETNSGPIRVTDSDTGIDYAYGVVVLEVHAV